jgi:hypothetical protein
MKQAGRTHLLLAEEAGEELGNRETHDVEEEVVGGGGGGGVEEWWRMWKLLGRPC